MPVISTRFPSTSRTYIPSNTVESYRKSIYSSSGSGGSSSALVDLSLRRSGLSGSYRSLNGDHDTSTASSHRASGVSTRYTSTTISSAIKPSATSSTSSYTRKSSIDRDFRSKPPIGSRSLRSDSRFRDLSLDNGFHTNSSTSASTIKSLNDSSSQSLTNPKRSTTTNTNTNTNLKPSASFARTVATSGADLYEKYSVANYKPNCELSRSRSLTDSTKLIDSLNANHHTPSSSSPSSSAAALHSSTRRSASTTRDRSASTSAVGGSGSLLAGNSSDYISNRSPSPVSVSVKVRNACFCVIVRVFCSCIAIDIRVSRVQCQTVINLIGILFSFCPLLINCKKTLEFDTEFGSKLNKYTPIEPFILLCCKFKFKFPRIYASMPDILFQYWSIVLSDKIATMKQIFVVIHTQKFELITAIVSITFHTNSMSFFSTTQTNDQKNN